MTAAANIRLVVETDDLDRLADDWWSLWRRVEAATPFQSPAWLVPWWHAFAPGPLRAVAAYDGRRMVALAPLYHAADADGQRLLPVGISLSDYLDVLIDPEAPAAVAAALMARAIAVAPAGAVELRDLAPDAAALRLPCPPGAAVTDCLGDPCPVLALPTAGEALGAAVPARQLRKIRMAGHRAARRGTVVTLDAGGGRAPALLDGLFSLHRRRWEQRGEPGVLADPRVERFHREACPRLVAAGLARLHGLAIGGRLVAVYYGLLHRDRAYAYLSGFDPDHAFESPGTLLLHHALCEAMHAGARELHFLRGAESYKYQWGAVDRHNRHRLFRPIPGHAAAA